MHFELIRAQRIAMGSEAIELGSLPPTCIIEVTQLSSFLLLIYLHTCVASNGIIEGLAMLPLNIDLTHTDLGLIEKATIKGTPDF